MNRNEMIKSLDETDKWDLIIIGGGATGLGAAVDAASRGYKTLLLEAHDFAKGTSSRSTKLIHGGLRYLKQGNINLVTEALKERGLLYKNAPHLIGHREFLVPNYQWWEGPFYGIGLKVYDLLAGDLGIAKSRSLSKEETLAKIPSLEEKDLRGGTIYFDGQFDDSRLAITLARTCADHNGILINYMPVTGMLKERGMISGVEAVCSETHKKYQIKAKGVINACGIFSDEIRKMDEKEAEKRILTSQGSHIILDRSFMKSNTAIMVPHTDDGRVLFIVPWKNHLVVGTTDLNIDKPMLEPKPFEEEIEFLLEHAGKYLIKDPKREDVLSVFSGIRPLVKTSTDQASSKVSRDHVIFASDSKLLSICGGKWTTYRKMAEDVIDRAIDLFELDEQSCITENLKLHGYLEDVHEIDSWCVYGSDARELTSLMNDNPNLNEPMHPDLTYLPVEVIWAVKHEMAIHLEDILARRTRSLFLNAKASIEIAEIAAKIMAKELGKDEEWILQECKAFKKLAKNYHL